MMLTRLAFPHTRPFDGAGEVDRFFRDFMRPLTGPAPRTWEPSVDVREDADSILLRADLPGVRPEDVKLTWENGVLTLSGERHAEKTDKASTFHRVERVHGTFERRFSLPKEADGAAAEASYENGVLTVVIPKRAEAKPRAIEIKTR
jgi:HSP20 family protein